MRFVLFLSLVVLAACATNPAPFNELAPPDFLAPTSGVCAGPARGGVETLTINADTPAPRCLKIRPTQRLRVLSKIQLPARVRVGGISFNVPAGKATQTDGGIGRYLDVGGHYVSISSYSGNTELVVVR